jgi:hypothetical protein
MSNWMSGKVAGAAWARRLGFHANGSSIPNVDAASPKAPAFKIVRRVTERFRNVGLSI